MTTGATTQRNGQARGEAFGLAAAALAAYLVLPQAALHGTDWRWFVLWLDEPGAVHPQHPGYLPLAHALRWLLWPCTDDAFTVLRVLSALGGALAVAGAHRAAWWLARDRAFARAAALLAAAAPAMFHFATVVELHAPFAAAMAFAVASAVRWAQSPSPRGALGTGALTGLAALLHGTGQLLVPALALALLWANRRRVVVRSARSVPWFLLAHVCVFGGLFVALRLSGHPPAAVAGFAALPDDPAAAGDPLAYLLRWWRDAQFAAQLPPTVLTEWLLPFAPLSLLAFAAVRRRDLAAWTGLFVLLLAGYLVVTVALVHAATDERGAYLLPLLLPAGWLALHSLPRRRWPWLVLATAVAGCLCRGEPGRLPPDREFGRAAAALARAQRTTFLVADFPEMDGAFVVDPRLDLLVARARYDDWRGGTGREPTAAEIAGVLQFVAHEQRQRGAQLVVTDAAVTWFAQRWPAFGPGFAQFAAAAGAERLDPATGIAGVRVR
ncbi:MAG: hypothetical protein FJ265_06800 [Planctomycetes bacterium]|nr:hypothetical protein [Planctomycetota bacterium]